MKKILVTGGAGFIGYHLSKELAEDETKKIHVVDNLSKGERDDLFENLIEKENVYFDKLDLSERSSFEELDDDYDQIYHLAAVVGVSNVMENPVKTIRVNTYSTLYLLDYIAEGMQQEPKILFASSCENYSESIEHCGVEIPTPEDVPLCIKNIENPRWTYAGSKILGEIACMQYAEEHDFRTSIVRYHNVFGPRMGTQHVIPEFILRVQEDNDVFKMYGGDQYRSFCYVEDAVKMTINVMESREANGMVVNVGDDNYVQIRELAEMIFDDFDVNPEIDDEGAPEGSIEKRKPDLSRIKELGCFTDRYNFIEALRKTIKWYK